jgi:hypothetical protein
MALSPADFYAYSRATGVPVPDSDEERAQMAGDVVNFRRNQLRAPAKEEDQGFNLTNALGIGAAALGLGAGALGLRSALAKKAAAAAGPVESPVVKYQNLEDLRRAAGYTTAPVRSEAPVQTPAPSKVATQEPLGELWEPTVPKEGFARSYLESKGSLLPAAKPDAGDRFIEEYEQLTRNQARADQRIQAGLREREMQIQGKGERVLAELRKEAADEASVFNDMAEYSRLQGMEQDQPLSRREQRIKQAVTVSQPGQFTDLTNFQESLLGQARNQAMNAVESGEDQQTGRIKAQLQRNEDLDLGQVENLENIAQTSGPVTLEQDDAINRAASQLPDGLPVDQAEGLTVLDFQNKQSFRISPRALSQEQTDNTLVQQARQYLRAKEIDTDFNYSAENKIQAAQVRDRVEKARSLQAQADQILTDIRNENQPPREQLSPERFAAEFNKNYREELNDQLQLVDNARQRAELQGAQATDLGEDLESLLTGGVSPIETTMRGNALRGGKPNITGDIVYQDPAGEFVSADTGLKTKLKQGPEYEIKTRLLNELNKASDEDLTEVITKGQQAPMNQYLKNLVTSKFTKYGPTQQLSLPIQSVDLEQTFGTQFDERLAGMASDVLRTRASRNQAPTPLQLGALDRARASVAASQEVLQQARNLRPTVPSGPAQDVARSMETLRRGMIVDPSEPQPVFPSVNQLRTGYATDEDLGPILGAADVYTGAAAEAAGPVIFTGKSKANSVIRQPRITGSIETPTGRYSTQSNPDVLGTVYNVAGTRANRATSAQVEANAQAFLADALTGGLTTKAVASPEKFVTPGRTQLNQLELLSNPGESAQVSRMSPLSLQATLGLPGQEPSKRTLYAQYQPGRSAPTPLSPFIGDMTGGTVVIQPTTSASPSVRRDIGTPSESMNLTRRGEKVRYYSNDPQAMFVTGLEPAPIGPLTQSPGLSRIGGQQEQMIMGAGSQGPMPVIQSTTQGQKIAYPRMDKPVTAEGFRGSKVTNIPPYGIDPGAEDWRNDLMRSAYRRGGPLRTYQG